MKRIFSIQAACAAVLLAVCCTPQGREIKNTPAVNVTTEVLSPNTNESGTVRAYTGTTVTMKGVNLDKAGKVTLNETEAEIALQEFKTLSFIVPDLGLPQKDDPQLVELRVYDADRETVVFLYDYFITVPVTDPSVSGWEPKEGTAGTGITVSGRNLDCITAVSLGSVNIPASDFTAQAGNALSFNIPAMAVTEADTQVGATALWAGGEIPFEGTFKYRIPVFEAYTQTAALHLGDEITFNGQNLDLVQALLWGDEQILIVSSSAAAIEAKIPSGLALQDPAIATKALTAVYGTPGQQASVCAGFTIDTTPIGPAAPIFVSATPADEGYDGFYLGREVVVRGENFASIEKFELDGKEVELSSPADDVKAAFVIPGGMDGSAAREMTLTAIWNGGNKADFGTLKVHPFYYTKGLRIGIGSNSKSTYPDYNRQNAFLLLNEGRVISVDDWFNTPVDAAAASGSNTVTSSNKINGSKADYYAARPYLFATASSAHKLAFQNPANSASQLKTHVLSSNTALPSTFGTPILYMKIMGEGELKTAVASGSLEDILEGFQNASTSAPAFGTAEGSTWVKGSVIAVQYVKYEVGATGGKPASADDVMRSGYLYIRDITCGDPATGLALASRDGYIEIDLYWSQASGE